MAVKALIATSYLWRLGLFSLLFIFFGFYFLHDGFVTYPRQNEMAVAYDQFVAQNRPAEEWTTIAHQHGWSEAMPTERPQAHSQQDMITQRVLGCLVTPFGLACGIFFLTRLGRWVASDDQGISTSGGKRAAFAQIIQLDKARWKNKGIAIVRYRGDRGGESRIILDDCNYQAQPTTAILREVEAHLKPDQIVGGAPAPAAGQAPAPPA